MQERIFDLIPNLSPQSRELVKALVKQLCQNEGINVPLDPAIGLQTLEEGIPLWEASLVGAYAPGSIRLYTHYVRHILSLDPAPTALSIQQHLASELLNGMSPTAVRSELKALKSFFGYLYDQGLWPENPVRNLKPPKVPRKEIKSPKPEEVARLLSVIDKPKIRAMLTLFCDTGIRFRELSGLEWPKVDLANREITVLGKGNKERTVPISPVGCMALESIKDISNGSDLVFPSRSMEGWDNRDANRSLARLCRKAGIRKYTCHQFRHFFATWTLQHGGDLRDVSEMLGHVRTSTTVDFYAHTDKKRIRKTHERSSPFAGVEQLKLLDIGKVGGEVGEVGEVSGQMETNCKN